MNALDAEGHGKLLGSAFEGLRGSHPTLPLPREEWRK